MKKVLLSVLALGCSLAALAQGPTTPTTARRADKAAKERKHEAKTKQPRDHDDDHHDDGRTHDRDGQPANHGQTVSTFAKSTTLTGADEGAAVRAVARAGRSTGRGEREARTPRTARGGRQKHEGQPAGSGHQANSRGAGNGHRAVH